MFRLVFMPASFCAFIACSFGNALADDDAQESLVAALKAERVEDVVSALESGADPSKGVVPPLVIAAMRQDEKSLAALLEVGADVNGLDLRGRGALVAALRVRNHSMMKQLIAAGADVNLAEKYPGRSPLQLVIDEAPSLQSMELLLDAGADIDQQDARGETALASAAFMNEPEALRVLLTRGARLDIVNNKGISPMEWAKRQGHEDIVTMLQDAGMQ